MVTSHLGVRDKARLAQTNRVMYRFLDTASLGRQAAVEALQGERQRFFHVVSNGHVAAVRSYVRYGIDLSPRHGRTWLTFAVRFQQVAVARVLVRAGVALEHVPQNQWDTSNMHYAARHGPNAMAELLLGAGAEPDLDGLRLILCHRGYSTYLQIRSRLIGHERVQPPQDLANVNENGNENITILHSAAANADLRVVKDVYSLCYNAGVDCINAQGLNGQTPLMIAILARHEDVAIWLMQRGADIRIGRRGGLGATDNSLHLAINAGLVQVVWHMLSNPPAAAAAATTVSSSPLPPPIFEPGYNMMTPLHLAVRRRNVEIVKLIVPWYKNRAAELDARNTWDDTALHIAARMGDRRIVRLLLRAGADRSIANDMLPEYGGMPADHARCNRRVGLGTYMDGWNDHSTNNDASDTDDTDSLHGSIDGGLRQLGEPKDNLVLPGATWRGIYSISDDDGSNGGAFDTFVEVTEDEEEVEEEEGDEGDEFDEDGEFDDEEGDEEDDEEDGGVAI